MIAMTHNTRAVHPGDILRHEFMEPAGITQVALAKATGLSTMQISNILRGKRSISAETAMRLERALGVSTQTWINLQTLYDIERVESEIGDVIKATTSRIVMKETYVG